MGTKKFLVLGVLFILPIVAYLFFASGIHHFGKLPIVTNDVAELDFAEGYQLQDKITVLGFLGTDLDKEGPALFNLNQKIYNYFYKFTDFQFVFLVSPDVPHQKLNELIAELDKISDMGRWHFIYAGNAEIQRVFKSLKSPYTYHGNDASPYIFIVDKDRNLRGRDDDEDEGTLYGYDYTDVAELANKMKDDIKIVLAEYRLELKKNNAKREI